MLDRLDHFTAWLLRATITLLVIAVVYGLTVPLQPSVWYLVDDTIRPLPVEQRTPSAFGLDGSKLSCEIRLHEQQALGNATAQCWPVPLGGHIFGKVRGLFADFFSRLVT